MSGRRIRGVRTDDQWAVAGPFRRAWKAWQRAIGEHAIEWREPSLVEFEAADGEIEFPYAWPGSRERFNPEQLFSNGQDEPAKQCICKLPLTRRDIADRAGMSNVVERGSDE